ncbi:MAG: hypothetical protein QXR87_02500 [Candidatus Hadarchaeales archaeon]
MKFYEVRVELNSPAIITSRRTERGFKSAIRFIPGTTLRGAILSSLYYHGRISLSELEREAKEPSLICTPAYPLVNGQQSWPAHPFFFRCKLCSRENREKKAGGQIEKGGSPPENRGREARVQLESGMEPTLPTRCREGHVGLESLHPEPVLPSCERAGEVRVGFTSSVCVGINKDRASFEGGMLYEYDALESGQAFWAYLATPYEIPNPLAIWVGRGVTRGFGEAKLSLQGELDMRKLEEDCKKASAGGVLVLYALSPLLGGGEEVSPFPKKIELGPIGERLGKPAEGSLLIERVYGRTGPYVAGWDMLRGRGRPTFYGACYQGSIVKARLEGNVSWEAIACLRILGTLERWGEETLCCINQLVPLAGHQMEREHEPSLTAAE